MPLAVLGTKNKHAGIKEMIKIALQNNGQLMADSLFPVDGRGSSLAGGSENTSLGRDSLPFSVIFAKMVNKASQIEETASSPNGQGAGITDNNTTETDIAGKQRSPLFMMKKMDSPLGKEKDTEPSAAIGELLIILFGNETEQAGDEVLAWELDLPALLQIIQNEKAIGESPNDATALQGDVETLLSYLAAKIPSMQKQDGTIEMADIEVSGRELASEGMQDKGETIRSAIDKLLSSGGKFIVEGTDKGNKIDLTVPQDLLKDFVVNRNGRPHFSMDGSTDGPLSGEAEVVAPGQDVEGKTLQLVRLNTQASSSSPQGAFLAVIMGEQKSHPSVQQGMKTDPENMDVEGGIPGKIFSDEALLRTDGGRRVQETLLHHKTGSEPDGTTTPPGTNPRQELVSPEEEFGEQVRIAADHGPESGEESSVVREDTVKGARLIAGKESAQWVPYVGLSTPQVPPDTVTSMKGVFIPMDEVISKAGTALDKGGKVQMTLQPPSLGTINMEVVVQNNRVELVMSTGHADVQQMLQAGVDQLKSILQNQGFQVDQMSVLLRQDNFSYNPGGNSLWQDGSGQKDNNGNESAAFPSTVDAEPVMPRDDYVKGTISIFA